MRAGQHRRVLVAHAALHRAQHHRRRAQGLHRPVRARRRGRRTVRRPTASRGPAEPQDDERRQFLVVRDGRASRSEVLDARTVVSSARLAARDVSAVELAQDSIARLESVQRRTRRGRRARSRTIARGGPAPTNGSRRQEPAERWKASRSRSRTGSTSRAGRSPVRRPSIATVARTRDATAVARLRAAGAVVVGITTALADSPAHGRRATRATRRGRRAVRPRAPRSSSRRAPSRSRSAATRAAASASRPRGAVCAA